VIQWNVAVFEMSCLRTLAHIQHEQPERNQPRLEEAVKFLNKSIGLHVDLCLLGVAKVLSNIEFFFAEIRQRLITSGLANRSSPTLTTPKCINNIKKLSLLHSYTNKPFAACGLCEKQINF